jgi:hypothetical protein
MNRAVGWLMVMALLVAAGPARAAMGDGIRVGGAEGRLHPFIDLEVRYDSNVATYYQPVYVPGGPPVSALGGDVIIHVRPGLQLKVPGESVAVDLRAVLDWAQYLGVQDSATKDLSNLYADVALGVGFNRKGQFGFELGESFVRSNQPYVYSVATGVTSNYNDLTLAVPWRPGGGALTTTLGGAWVMETFEAFKSDQICGPSTGDPFCNPAYLSDLAYNNFAVNLGVNWKFLPKTAAVLDLSWFDQVPRSTLYSIAGTGLRAQVGATGLITSHLVATLKGGYATTLKLSLDPAAAPPQPDLSTFGTWLAQVSAEWIPVGTTSVKASFSHDLGFDPGTIWALYTNTHASLEAKGKIGGMFTASLFADWGLLGYRDPDSSTSTILTVKPAVQAELNRWLLLELAYQYTDRSTTAPNPPSGWVFSKNEVWLRGVVTY